MSPIQQSLFGDTLQQKFDAWKATPGGKHVLNILYRKAAGYAARYQRTKRRVSIRLLWEQTRDHVSFWAPQVKARLDTTVDGYRLNDHLHAYAARHILAHKPEWHGMFHLREVGREKPNRKVTVLRVEERKAA